MDQRRRAGAGPPGGAQRPPDGRGRRLPALVGDDPVERPGDRRGGAHPPAPDGLRRPPPRRGRPHPGRPRPRDAELLTDVGPATSGADRIELRGLRVLGTHGVLPEERSRPQPFEIDLDVFADLRVAGRSDDLADTIDYGAVATAAAAAVEGPHADLLEHLAERVAEAALG
ncbi:dihydroneopterin aldolase, partial [Acidimicrobiaceae bacterium USS-CC1]|nr:dihydroneopterin aldolase [Acidiferrimicrobium australe]